MPLERFENIRIDFPFAITFYPGDLGVALPITQPAPPTLVPSLEIAGIPAVKTTGAKASAGPPLLDGSTISIEPYGENALGASRRLNPTRSLGAKESGSASGYGSYSNWRGRWQMT